MCICLASICDKLMDISYNWTDHSCFCATGNKLYANKRSRFLRIGYAATVPQLQFNLYHENDVWR